MTVLVFMQLGINGDEKLPATLPVLQAEMFLATVTQVDRRLSLALTSVNLSPFLFLKNFRKQLWLFCLICIKRHANAVTWVDNQ